MTNLSNVMCVITQGDPKPILAWIASQDRKIAYLEFEINYLIKQFVIFKYLVDQSTSSPLVSNLLPSPSLSQTFLNPYSFVAEPSLRPPKLVPYCRVDPSFVSNHTAASCSHSSVVAAKMVVIYATKGNEVSINVHQHFFSTPTSNGKHIRFTYSSDEDEDKEE